MNDENSKDRAREELANKFKNNPKFDDQNRQTSFFNNGLEYQPYEPTHHDTYGKKFGINDAYDRVEALLAHNPNYTEDEKYIIARHLYDKYNFGDSITYGEILDFVSDAPKFLKEYYEKRNNEPKKGRN